jgi:hypothetical protein
MFTKRFLCAALVLVFLGSLALSGLAVSCWPCDTDPGCPFPGWQEGGDGSCYEYLYH